MSTRSPARLAMAILLAALLLWPAMATAQDDPIDADQLRGVAEEILSGRAYAETQPSVLERLFDWLRGLFEFNPPSPQLDAPNLGSPLIGLRSALIIVFILALVAWATYFVIKQRTAVRHPDEEDGRPGRGRTAAELERLAADATRRGDYREALRFRFEAGLVRLERKGTLDHHTTQTTQEVSETLHLPEFDRVAAGFEEVVYGGREAVPADDALSAATWPVIVEKAPRPEKDT